MRRLLTTFGALTLIGALALAFLPHSLELSSTGTDDAGAESKTWHADFDEAVTVAKREHKDLLVYFTGSDWCGPCIRLDREVFSHDSFLEGAKEDFVLVKLDFPRSEKLKAKVPNPARNEELQVRYGVRGFPTILLMTPDGVVLGQTGYREGGPEKYVAHLKELERVKSMLADLDQLEGEEHAAALDRAIAELEGLGEAGSAFAVMLAEGLRKELREGQPVEVQRRLLKALLAAGLIDDELLARAREYDPQNEGKLFEAAVFALVASVASEEQLPPTLEVMESLLATGNVASEQELHLRITAADWYHRFIEDPAAARVHAKRALELAPAENEPMIGFLRRILDAR